MDATNTAIATVLSDDTRASLKRDVYEIIRPHTASYHKPPFTTCELITIALVVGQGLEEGMTDEDILYGILDLFQYYSKLANRAYTKARVFGRGDGGRIRGPMVLGHAAPIEDPLRDFDAALYSYDLPVTSTLSSEGLFENSTYTHRIATSEARYVLRSKLEPARTGTYGFFELLPELRTSIYEYCFHVGEIAFDRPGYGGLFQPLENAIQRLVHSYKRINGTSLEPHRRPNLPLRHTVLPPIQDLLALARTSKGVHKEAMSVFFSINTFTFLNILRLSFWTTRVPPQNLQHLTKINIHLNFGPDCIQPFESAMKALTCVKKLSLCGIDLRGTNDSDWQNHTRGPWGRAHTIADVPGIPDLAALIAKAKHLEFNYVQNEAPQLKGFLDGSQKATDARKLNSGMQDRIQLFGNTVRRSERLARQQ